jgi:hypothetical protein
MSVESYGDDVVCGKILTRPPELSGSPTNRVIWERVREMDEEVRILLISN